MAFHTHERNDYALQTWYFGMVTAMVLFNLLLFIALKDNAYLLYVAFVLFAALAISAANGLGKEFIWPDTTLWSDIASSTCYAYMMAALLLFERRMLNTRELVPRLDRLIKILVGLSLLLPIGVVVFLQTSAKPARFTIGAALLVNLFICGYCAVFKRQRIAIVLMVAYFMLLLGLSLIGMKILGVLSVNVFTTNGFLIGSALEMLVMAFALSYRFNMIRSQATEDVQQANADLEQRLQTREAELMHSHERLREVEQRETLSQERQRLTQDMHDGLGSSLMSALRVVEDGSLVRLTSRRCSRAASTTSS